MTRITQYRDNGFTLLELLIVLAITGILAGVMYANFSQGSAASRDAKRKSDLRNLKSAIEAYKQKKGYYPAGCNGAGKWSGGTYTCPSNVSYIIGLAPEYIPRLPFDTKLPTNGHGGYVYVSNRNSTANTGGEVYKLMAMNTVEVNKITSYSDSFKSCDIRPHVTATGLEQYPSTNSNQIDTGGWCSQLDDSGGTNFNSKSRCKLSTDGGNGRLDNSYGVWGGYMSKGSGHSVAEKVQLTTSIICK